MTRKAEQLKTADRQSRHTFDILDFWIDWFVETRDNIIQAEKPSVDMECLKAQLKHQRILNEEIANERAGLRDVIVDASKVARDLNSTLGDSNQDNRLVSKVEARFCGNSERVYLDFCYFRKPKSWPKKQRN